MLHPALLMHLVPPLLAPLLRGGTKRGETVIVVSHNNKDHHHDGSRSGAASPKQKESGVGKAIVGLARILEFLSFAAK